MSQNAQPEDSGSLRSRSEAYRQLYERFQHQISDHSGQVASAGPRRIGIILLIFLLGGVLGAIVTGSSFALRGRFANPTPDVSVVADVNATQEAMDAHLKDADTQVKAAQVKAKEAEAAQTTAEAAQATAEAAQATAEAAQTTAEATQATAEAAQATAEAAQATAKACAGGQGYAYKILANPDFSPDLGTPIDSLDEGAEAGGQVIESKVTWRIKNTGQCEWNKIILMAGDEDNRRIIDGARVSLDMPLAPGEESDLVMTFAIEQASQAIDETYTLFVVYGPVQPSPESNQVLEVSLAKTEWFVPQCSPDIPSDWEKYEFKQADGSLLALLRKYEIDGRFDEIVKNNCILNPSVISAGTKLFLPKK